MSRPVDVLIDFLKSEEARGVTQVYLDEEARAALRELHRQKRKGPKLEPVAEESAEVSPAEASKEMEVSHPPRVVEAPVVVSPDGGSAAEKIAALKAQAAEWPAARALGSLRETMVFSVGNPDADLMLVGEAPGYQEEREQEPFVGPAGQKLNEILKAMGLSREAAYISNIVKFRPSMERQTTNNRKPTVEEMAACMPFVREEVRIVRPKCIVALGATAAEGLLGLTGAVARMREQWHTFEGIPVRVTYHPAYLLHGSAALQDKRKIWEDMLAVMEQLGLSISEKQQGFFLPK
ncbi:DNA polymerase [Haloferula luteola]|uniref:Type-4 uracil-DNA glycosylase n=1 Tax=Haloferula luteola TaxID=595692 RepID=A0A840V1Q1_9BACT|nr:uracil-DNA glycosylase [Haloferula luteola]MBB5351922.1 DNA polymerase [Haloferula luteola]